MATSPRLNQKERFTYSDYLTWPDDERWEIIYGVAYAMSPAPGMRHQELSGEIFRQLANYLKGKPCKPFAAPFDVRLSENESTSDNYIETVVQPDIVVVCDRSKLDDKGCKGAPDLVIEITSPSTAKNDVTIKFDLYQSNAVKEYWIIQPEDQTVMVFKLQDNRKYAAPERYAANGRLPVPLLGDLVIDLGEVFAQ
jgi:Uma2 family endonuclease